MDFYVLLQVEVNKHLNDLYTLLVQSDIEENFNSTNKPHNSNNKKKEFDKLYNGLMSALHHRNYYCERNHKKIPILHELVLLANGLEQNLMEMFKKPRVCNRENKKFVQMFMTILDSYLSVIWSFEINTRIQHESLDITLNQIFRKIKLE